MMPLKRTITLVSSSQAFGSLSKEIDSMIILLPCNLNIFSSLIFCSTDLDNPYSEWVKLPDLPNPEGFTKEGTTHSPPVAIGNVYYQAGGLVGGAKPDHVPISDVYKFDFDTYQWSKLPPLPKTIFGGGMVYEG